MNHLRSRAGIEQRAREMDGVANAGGAANLAPGLLATAISSLTVRTGTDGLTTMMCASPSASCDTGRKSRPVSYGSFL
jgi:hypothetical protein